MMGAEFENIQALVQEEIDPAEEPEKFKRAVETNSEIYKANLKKVMKLMGRWLKFLSYLIVEEIWRKNTQEVAEEYTSADRTGLGSGSYFYDNYYGPNYYVHE